MSDIAAIKHALASVVKDYLPENQHWVHGDDEGIDLCEKCAQVRVDALRLKDPTGEYFVDGGWGCMESDGVAVCADCGKPLSYTLTDFGVLEELDHFSSTRLQYPFSQQVAYELLAILENWPPDEKRALGKIKHHHKFFNRTAFRKLLDERRIPCLSA